MKRALASVIANEEIAQGVFIVCLEEQDQARDIQPGQFIHVRCGTDNDPLLRRPLSVLRTGASPVNKLRASHYEVLYDVVGRGTEILSRARAGDLLDVLGPLGRPFKIERNTRHLLLVGGGVGIVPLVALAEEAIRRDVTVTLLCGFRTASKVFPADRLPAEVEYHVATDDGSTGHRGFVTKLTEDHVSWADQICACGPVAMLKALAKLERPRALPVQIAMEERMGCAMGVCLGCVVPTRHGPRRVCRDGPVFSIDEMGWT